MSELTVFMGKHIRELRKSQGLSQEELAFKANINAAHLGQLERGLKSPTIDTIDKIAIALGIPLINLFDVHSSNRQDGDNSISITINNLISTMDIKQQKVVLKIIQALTEFDSDE